MTDEDYRQSLRSDLKNRRFQRKHYDPKMLAQLERKRRQELEGQIAERKEELRQTKPQGIVRRMIGKIIPKRS